MTEQTYDGAGPKKLTADEVVESLTGWDELAIERAAGMPLAKIAQSDEIKLVRLLAAVVASREDGVKFDVAYKAVMDKPQREVLQVFAEDEVEDVLADEPDSESGKDVSRPGDAPMTSPPSASLPEFNPANTQPSLA